MRVENMTSTKGNKIANQFRIFSDDGVYFQSYDTVIAFKPHSYPLGILKIQLDLNAWDYSVTTGKYRNIFLDEKKKDTERKIASGEYILTDLNGPNDLNN